MHSDALLRTLSVVAPGQPLREGIDRIQQSGKGALIVVGDGPDVLNICSGGFLLDAAFSPQRLSEVAKMDGAIILASDASRIARANVHLVPNPNIPTSETGTRHRTAERVARSIRVPVISVSESRDSISVYVGDDQYPLHPSGRLLARANQAIQTLERYRTRLDHVSLALSALEVEDLVTVHDVVSVLQRSEMVRRIGTEIEMVIVELGTDGQLVVLQLEELVGSVHDDRQLVLRDYLPDDDPARLLDALRCLDRLETTELLDSRVVATRLNLGGPGAGLESVLQPRGYRLLSRIPRLPEDQCQAIVARFGTLQRILRAPADEIGAVVGVEGARAKAVKESLSRLAESSILDRYS